MTGTKVLNCDCKHEYQDKVYGKGRRIHNLAMKGIGANPGYRCTICKKIKSA